MRGSIIMQWVELGLKMLLWGTGQGQEGTSPMVVASFLSVAASAVTASKHGTWWQMLLPFLFSTCPAAACAGIPPAFVSPPEGSWREAGKPQTSLCPWEASSRHRQCRCPREPSASC